MNSTNETNNSTLKYIPNVTVPNHENIPIFPIGKSQKIIEKIEAALNILQLSH